ncbi:hypothetical protein AB6A40_008003 [Gnathostoma spinigerum]|uniref:Uncharacterized protein n=1 Tax=Gnathostoma spinigerum TaxID=75299 RepID=A0ABD6ESZ8_9BILA
MDTLVELTNKYKLEAVEAIDKFKASSATLQDDLQAKVQSTLNQLQPLIDQSKEELISSIQDQSPSLDLNVKRLTETYMWTSVLLIGLTAGAILGGVVLPGIIGLFVSGFYAAIIAYGVLPVAAIYYLRQPLEASAENDMKRRHQLLLFSATEVSYFSVCFAYTAPAPISQS